MKIDLIELLRTKEVVHPTVITAAELRAGSLHVFLSGYPWWLDVRRTGGPPYEFSFKGVSGNIDADMTGGVPSDGPWDEALDDLSVQSLVEADWAKPQVCEIYCSEPLKDPLALYILLESYLHKVDSYFPVQHFLNCGESGLVLSSFAKISTSNSFLLARVPEIISELLVRELARQNVRHNVVRKSYNWAETRLRVRFNGCDFLCHSAIAILPD